MVSLTTIGILPHPGKKAALELTQRTIKSLEERGAIVWLDEKAAELLDRMDLTTSVRLEDIDVLLVFGGDGTLLSAARRAVMYGIPILGVNAGHLGFLTELEANQLESALDALVRKEYSLEERMFIACKVVRNNCVVAEYRALNDVVITRGTFARIIQLATYVDDQPVVEYQADGIIIATPTGSTAYSLSAGGPIVVPQLDCLIITPICPHTLAARSVIVRHDSQVKVKVAANHRDMMLTIDGQVGFPLQSGDCIETSQANVKAKFVKLQGRDFFSILNNRFKSIHGRKEFDQ